VFAGSIAALHLKAQPQSQPAQTMAATALSFVGSERCSSCHGREASAWKTSQHHRALQAAAKSTVLGRFDGATFEKDGVATTFRERDGRFLIDTAGPDGKPGTFEVKYTLGLEPLQQYLLEMPGGRLQAFGIAWDSQPAASGGQRWFDLYPGQKLAAGDPIHWTGIQQTANYMCIDCHVTNLRKGFDVSANAYQSTWSEAGVGCEACHGPGSAHVASPRVSKLPAHFPARAHNVWGTDPDKRPQVAEEGRAAEVETCGRCHARRSQLTDAVHAGQNLADGFRVSPLEAGLYQVDGQMRDEVFNHGSFLQSRMFAKGVSCSDCHDPHTQKLRAEGNALCEQCHQPARYESRTHHFHDPASKAGQCVSCHMPIVTYMIVDPRHDHSFRVPRPDLSAKLGVPDVCSECHRDKPAGWAASELQRRLGHAPSGFQTFGEAFFDADRGAPGAASRLARIANDAQQPAMVRASAIARSLDGVDLDKSSTDKDDLVRAAAAEAIAAGDSSAWVAPLARLLRDPVLAVRIQAARALAGPTEQRLGDADRAAFRTALDEYTAVQRYNADRGEAHMNLALLELRRGNTVLADEHLLRSIAIDPTFVPAYLQLADLYRRRQEEPRAAELLQRAIARNPESAAAHHALGLSLVRQRRLEAALAELGRAAELEPATASYSYVHAVALNQAGRTEEARKILEQVLARHSYDIDSLVAAANWAIQRGDRAAALGYLRTLQELRPADPQITSAIDRLRATRP
jgi:predicted CXXCH cytochrome family protein